MGKNKRSQVEYNGYSLDSIEEYEYMRWCEIGVEMGLIAEWEYQPMSWMITNKRMITVEKQLKTKVKSMDRHLLDKHQYTCDFRLRFNRQFIDIFSGDMLNHVNVGGFKYVTNDDDIYVDIKGGFNRFGGDRTFSIHQKLVYDKFGIFVHKIIPIKLFTATYCPEDVRYTIKTNKLRTKYASLPSIDTLIG